MLSDGFTGIGQLHAIETLRYGWLTRTQGQERYYHYSPWRNEDKFGGCNFFSCSCRSLFNASIACKPLFFLGRDLEDEDEPASCVEIGVDFDPEGWLSRDDGCDRWGSGLSRLLEGRLVVGRSVGVVAL